MLYTTIEDQRKAQATRTRRAAEEMARYQITDLPGGRAKVSHGAADYFVTADYKCSCPDVEHNLKGTPVICKHGSAVLLRKMMGGASPLPEAPPVPSVPYPTEVEARRAEYRRRLAADFPDD